MKEGRKKFAVQWWGRIIGGTSQTRNVRRAYVRKGDRSIVGWGTKQGSGGAVEESKALKKKGRSQRKGKETPAKDSTRGAGRRRLPQPDSVLQLPFKRSTARSDSGVVEWGGVTDSALGGWSPVRRGGAKVGDVSNNSTVITG